MWLDSREKWVSWNQLPKLSPVDNILFSAASRWNLCQFFDFGLSRKIKTQWLTWGLDGLLEKGLNFLHSWGRHFRGACGLKMVEVGMMELLGEDSPSPCGEESAPAQEGGEVVVVCGKACS